MLLTNSVSDRSVVELGLDQITNSSKCGRRLDYDDDQLLVWYVELHGDELVPERRTGLEYRIRTAAVMLVHFATF